MSNVELHLTFYPKNGLSVTILKAYRFSFATSRNALAACESSELRAVNDVELSLEFHFVYTQAERRPAAISALAVSRGIRATPAARLDKALDRLERRQLDGDIEVRFVLRE